jgi:hypothetical protein
MTGGTLEYTISSLPNLAFQNTTEFKEQLLSLFQKYSGGKGGAPGPIEVLDQEACKFLPPAKYDLFQKIELRNIHESTFRQSRSRVLSRFSAFNLELKQQLAKWRKGEKPEKSEIVHLAAEGNPLVKEIRIMQYQWQQLEELSIGHFADFDALIIYKLKLLILLRWWSFHTEQGLSVFKQLTSME